MYMIRASLSQGFLCSMLQAPLQKYARMQYTQCISDQHSYIVTNLPS